MKEVAEVTAVDGNRVTVTTQLKTACSGCAQVSNCGAGILSKVLPTEMRSLLWLPNKRLVPATSN